MVSSSGDVIKELIIIIFYILLIRDNTIRNKTKGQSIKRCTEITHENTIEILMDDWKTN